MGLRSTIADALLMLRYGTRRPDAVWIPGGPVPIRVNPADRRARNLIARRAARGMVSTARRLWMTAVERLEPDLAIDVGTNYGECLLGIRYPSRTLAIGIEANPDLIPLLTATWASHPDRERIRLVHGLASDTDGVEGVLHFDPSFTGTASAVTTASSRLPRHVIVRSVTIDTLVSQSAAPEPPTSVVFKLDIEGFEGVAMRGFRRLAEFRDFVGILEFDLEYLAGSPVNGDTLLGQLLGRGLVLDSARGIRDLRRIESMGQLKALHEGSRSPLHTDLILASSATVLPRSWRIR